MEPVSLGIAAAALLAAKFGEGFAKDAGTSAWSSVKRLRAVVAEKFHKDPEFACAVGIQQASSNAADVPVVAARITAAAAADQQFAAEVEHLVRAAQENHVAEVFVAQAFDQARQVNIRGDNAGTINLTN